MIGMGEVLADNQYILKEACVDSYAQALSAYKQGAQRVELCSDLAVGGVTPSYGTILMTHKLSQLVGNIKEMIVMIRPRGGNFVYTLDEIKIMMEDIQMCKQIGVTQVIFGVLHSDNTLNYEQMQMLVEIARPMLCACHMAIDETEDYDLSINQLIKLGFSRVLTKGGKYKNAIQGKDSLKKLESKGYNIQIIAGGGITGENYLEFQQYTGLKQVHGTKLFDLSQ